MNSKQTTTMRSKEEKAKELKRLIEAKSAISEAIREKKDFIKVANSYGLLQPKTV